MSLLRPFALNSAWSVLFTWVLRTCDDKHLMFSELKCWAARYLLCFTITQIVYMKFQVIPVNSGSCTLKDAVNEALRDWVTNLSTTHYLVGSAIGPHPFPTIVRDFQKVIGEEIKVQMQVLRGKLPDVVVACVGGGSNAIGTFYDFIGDKNVRLVGVEAGGEGDTNEYPPVLHLLTRLLNRH